MNHLSNKARIKKTRINKTGLTITILLCVFALSSQVEAISTRIGNVVECRQENNNGNGLYIKREYCYRYATGTYGDSYSEDCYFRAYFTAEADKGNSSVIASLRERSAFAPNAERYTDIRLWDNGNVKFDGTTSGRSDKYTSTYSHFYFRPVDDNGHFEMKVETSDYGTPYKTRNFSYTYNCSYIP